MQLLPVLLTVCAGGLPPWLVGAVAAFSYLRDGRRAVVQCLLDCHSVVVEKCPMHLRGCALAVSPFYAFTAVCTLTD